MPVVVDLSHTAHCAAATGVQRVTRQLLAALEEIEADPVPVVYDPYAKRWRAPDAPEAALLHPAATESPAASRREVWTLGLRVRGYLRRGAAPDWVSLRGAPLLALREIFHSGIGSPIGTAPKTGWAHGGDVLRRRRVAPSSAPLLPLPP